MARNIHALIRIRDQDQNKMAAIAAIKLLESLPDDMPTGGGQQITPGLTVVFETAPAPARVLPGIVLDAAPKQS
jgi:hypothetical protein